MKRDKKTEVIIEQEGINFCIYNEAGKMLESDLRSYKAAEEYANKIGCKVVNDFYTI